MFSWLIRTAQRRGLVPRMSATEREALAAGTVWVEGDLFSGRPDLGRLAAEPYPELTAEEREFLDGPVEEVCRMVDPWRLSRERELSPAVWDFLRAHGFFGLAIPREWGGKGFSALGQSAVFGKLATRAMPLSAVVLIPNSVGPGELLLAYGTAEQKRRFLPRLARGEEIPCFALTEPEAGSDAASLVSEGVVFAGADGRPWMRLDWEKRYITLAPVATLLGLAFRLRDPGGLLGLAGPEAGVDGDLGITLALVPTSTPGVEVGRRHDPMGIPLPNGPTSGRGVELPVDAIVGGPTYAGRGWKMLMEALAAGRAISLPAQAAAGGKMAARVAGAYGAVRRQFGVAIDRFEGVEERLARIAGHAYLMEAARVFTCAAVDAGHRPAVLAAAMKYRQTELARETVIDAMDVLGGAALCRGPNNPFGDGYQATAIGITVEGANILTRTLIVFGQGAIRCHPHLGRELTALEAGDPKELRRAVLGHTGFFLRNLLRAVRLELSRGRLNRAPATAGATAALWRRFGWAASRFALLTDLALLAYGPRIKLKEKLAGRFADALSWWFLGVAALRRFAAEGSREEDLPLARWAAEHSLAEIQSALEGVAGNIESPLLGWLARGPGALWLRLNRLSAPPADRSGRAVAAAIGRPGGQRDRLTAGIYVPTDADEAVGRLERAFDLLAASRPAVERIAAAVRAGDLPQRPAGGRRRPEERAAEALAAGLVDRREADLLAATAAALRAAVEVDSFSLAEYLGRERDRSRTAAEAVPAAT